MKISILSMLDSLDEGILVLKKDRVIVFNEAAAKLLGKKKGELLKIEGELGAHLKECIDKGRGSYNLLDIRFSKGFFILSRQMGYIFHELRSPMTVIQGFAETLQDHELSKEMVKSIAEKISSSSKRLLEMVKKLLTLSAIENSQNFIPCKIQDIVKNCVKLFPVEVRGEKESLVLGDPLLLELAIGNLLENAVKYARGVPKISLEVITDKKFVKVAVSDEGIGMPKEALSKIFESFYSFTKSKGGVGLGLSLVKAILEKHKGRIEVISELGKGSTFTCILPLHKDIPS